MVKPPIPLLRQPTAEVEPADRGRHLGVDREDDVAGSGLMQLTAKEKVDRITRTAAMENELSQYTGTAFTDRLKADGVRISMDGRGRALDNRMVERLWRTVKYDDIYIRAYETMDQLRAGLKCFFHKYNTRSHQGLGRISPQEVYNRGTRGQAA